MGAVVLWLAGCSVHGTKLPEPIQLEDCSVTARRAASVFLIGDAGAPSLPGPGENPESLVDPVLRALRADVEEQLAVLPRDRVAVIYLGDNVYSHGLEPGEDDQHGLPSEDHDSRAYGEAVLEAQIRAAAAADLYFILGNHDWNKADPVDVPGRDRALEQGRFIVAHDSRARVLPSAGCAGPVAVNFGRNLRFVFVDAMGWSLIVEAPEEIPAECARRTSAAVGEAIKREFANPEARSVVFMMHHPLRTAGPHGGHYTWKQHIFPLTDFWPNAWIPLPIIGSAYPISRQLGVTNTDLSHKSYRRMVKFLTESQTPEAPTLYAAGHEHSLQVHRDQLGVVHVVSGAGSVSKVDRVEDMPGMLMGVAAPGYMRLDEYDDGTLRLSVTALDPASEPREIYQMCMPGYSR